VKLFSLGKTLFLSIITAAALTTAANAFTDLDSKQTTIEDEVGNGKWTIVEIWASDCHACRMHMPDMVEFDGKLDNVRVLGVALDGQAGKDDAKDMIDEYKMPFKNILSNPIEMNAWMELNAEEGLIGTPTFMIFNPEGVLTALQPGILPTKSLTSYIEANS
jgi:thiol-disulfide isomerase/thioredoxin